jgi:DNA recombination protein RmuC
MENSQFYLILASLLLGFGITLILLKSWLVEPKKTDNTLVQWLTTMQTTLESTQRTLHDSMRGTTTDVSRALQENTRQLNERLDNAAKVISDVSKNLGEMSEVGKGIKTLQEFLQSPKLRGGLGEQVLSDMIGQTFPKNAFHLQHSFKSGVKADAVLKTEAGLLCIDSKFPMANFNLMFQSQTEVARNQAKKEFVTDVKKHISDIAKKYILPEEETMDFALMYIPSENVYYEVVNTTELNEYARNLRVYPVSPNTLFAHLQVLLLSFQGKEMEAKSREVFKILRAIQKDYSKVEENMSVLNRHLTNAYNQMSQVSTGFNTLGQKLTRTNVLSGEEKQESELLES